MIRRAVSGPCSPRRVIEQLPGPSAEANGHTKFALDGPPEGRFFLPDTYKDRAQDTYHFHS